MELARRAGVVSEEQPVSAWMAPPGESAPELYLSPAAYDLARRITIRLRDTEARANDQIPAQAVSLIDTSA